MNLDYPKTLWRLIRSGPGRGAWNMAIDEAILEAVGQGGSPPTLRLYAWAPPCLSLGYAQPYGDVDPTRLAAHGWEVVRRPTGGRAILHTDELTYAVIAPLDEPRLAGSVLESYQRLSQALLEALHRLGIPAQVQEKAPAAGNQNPVCFEVPSNYEITIQGKKLIGSAQARRKEGVLQHGSLPLQGDLARILEGLSYPDDATRQAAGSRLLAHATTSEAILGYRLDWNTAAGAFVGAFEQVLNLQLQAEELTPAELARAEQLVALKYAHASWTQRV
jgi:lipoate-protein ligase A